MRSRIFVWIFAGVIFIGLFSCSSPEKKYRVALKEKKKIEKKEIIPAEKKILINPHFVTAQFHRWLILNERLMNEVRIQNQLDLLVDTVNIQLPAGEVKSKKDYRKRILQNKEWRNAHHVKKMDIYMLDDSSMAFHADVNYQCIKPNGVKDSYMISFYAQLKGQVDSLPLFSKISMERSNSVPLPYTDAYVDNRCRSLLYAWLGHLQALTLDENLMIELLAENFKINLSTGSVIDNSDHLKGWLVGSASLLESNRYKPERIVIKEISENKFQLDFELSWTGKTKDDKEMIGKTAQSWQLEDNQDWTFPKIFQIDIKQIQPFEFVEEADSNSVNV